MTLRVIGSGLGRTGTKSMKQALETLLGEPCYHMVEVFGRPDDPPVWSAALAGEPVDWDALFDGYGATVDWPSAALWKTLADVYPDALILHSERPPDEWFTSASNTIFHAFADERPARGENAWMDMAFDMLDTFTPAFRERAAAEAACERWNADVRATAPADRLLIWETGAGWEPLCDALGLPVPDEPFPHVNSTAEFREMMGLDPA